MKPKTLLILTALTLGLGAFIFFYEKDLPSTDERRERDKKVLGVEAEEVTGLVLRWGDEEVRLEKHTAAEDTEETEETDDFTAGSVASDTWRLTAPIEARANGAEVQSLVDRLIGLEKDRTLEDIDVEQLGLDSPRASVLVITGKGERSLRIGAELPLSSGVVMQGDDRSVAFKVDAAGDLVSELTRPAGEWRDKKLFTAERADIDRVTITRGDERLLLTRRGDAEIFFRFPSGYRNWRIFSS